MFNLADGKANANEHGYTQSTASGEALRRASWIGGWEGKGTSLLIFTDSH